MSHVAEFTIPAETFPFGETLAEMPDIEIELDQIIPTDESALPFFWVRGCEPAEFMTHAEHESGVRETRLLEEMDHVALFRAEWRPNARLIQGLKDLDVTIVESVGTAEHWRFEVRTQDRDTFGAFRETFEEEGIPISLTRLYSLDELIDGEHRTLSSKQRDTLLTAQQEGYFEKPREITQSELAEHFGVSRRAVSERLRRGINNLVSETLLPTGGDD
jgi:predicted DNA binding protein